MQEYTYYDTLFTPNAQGFHNTGAICWFNSILQFLLGVSSLNDILLQFEDEFAKNCFAQEYINLIKEALAGRSTSHLSAKVLNAMITRMKQLGRHPNLGTGQECADEAFTTIIDLLDSRRVENLFGNNYEISIVCPSCKQTTVSVRDQSYRISLFSPRALNTPTDFCTYLKIHKTQGDYYKCEKCGYKIANFERLEKLKMLRECVVIIFNKFQSKDNRWFPSELSFKALDGSTMRYQLTGKIEHSGTMHGGHYWANVLRHDTWYNFNDISVTAGNNSPTVNTFMICYQLVKE